MSTMLMQFANLQTLVGSTVDDVLANMGALGADQAAITIETDDGMPIGGLVCLHGPDTKRYMDAIAAVKAQIEQEGEQEQTARSDA